MHLNQSAISPIQPEPKHVEAPLAALKPKIQVNFGAMNGKSPFKNTPMHPVIYVKSGKSSKAAE